MKLTPLNDRILVQRIEKESKTSGGIIIPDTAKEKPAEAIVVAVGPGKRDKFGARVAPQVSVGERVLFSKYSGTDIKLSGEDYLILKEDDVLAALEA
jgi:chaperonin GroES